MRFLEVRDEDELVDVGIKGVSQCFDNVRPFAQESAGFAVDVFVDAKSRRTFDGRSDGGICRRDKRINAKHAASLALTDGGTP